MTIADFKIVVRSGSDIVVCVGSTLETYSMQSDNQELLGNIKLHLKSRTLVPIIPGKANLLVTSGYDSSLGLIAGMFAPNPGQSLVLHAPANVLFELRQLRTEGIAHWM